MIVRVWKEDDDVQFRTDGCGCCSDTLYKSTDRDRVISELKEAIDVIKRSCELLGLNFEEFVK